MTRRPESDAGSAPGTPVPGRRRHRLRRIAAAVATGAMALVAGAVAVAVVSAVSTGVPSAAPHPVQHDAPTTTAPDAPAVATAPPGTTLVATTDGAIPGYPAPGAPSDMTVPGTWFRYRSVLPVIAARPGWLEVRLAQRPNGSTARRPGSSRAT